MKKSFAFLFGMCALLCVLVSQPVSAAQSEHSSLGVAQVGTTPTAVLTWTASATAGSTVNVYRCAGVSCTAFAKITSTSGVVAGGPYTDSTVSAGAYSYYVTAVVNGAESAPSNTASVTISPQPPTGLSVVQ